MDRIRVAVVMALLVSMVGLASPTMAAGDNQRGRRDSRYEERRPVTRAWQNSGRYDAAQYYRRDDRRYKARRLGRNDRIYRGSDNRYYCERDDGTTGLIIGGMAGGVLGQVIAPGGSKTLGAILGAGAGAIIGRAIDKGDVTCR